MFREIAATALIVAQTVIGTVADVASEACSASGSNSNTCQQVQDLSTACTGQDALDYSDKE